MIKPSSLKSIGYGFSRPECVVSTKKGDIYASDSRGGIMWRKPNGRQKLIIGGDIDGRKIHPNGFALRKDGSFLVANLEMDKGGVYQLFRDGRLIPFLEQVDGRDLPSTNFVLEDSKGRVWITVSTTNVPRMTAFRADVSNGYIVLVDNGGVRVVADNLGYVNEIAFDPSGEWLYVNETFARKLSRFRVLETGDLVEKTVITTFDNGVFPDGIVFDYEGFAWIASIISNSLIRVSVDGKQERILEDSDRSYIAEVEKAYAENRMGKSEIDFAKGERLKNLSSLAFGGSDLKTVYLGSLLGTSIESFKSYISGYPPFHWLY